MAGPLFVKALDEGECLRWGSQAYEPAERHEYQKSLHRPTPVVGRSFPLAPLTMQVALGRDFPIRSPTSQCLSSLNFLLLSQSCLGVTF